MELRIWEYGKDDDKITSFLTSAALAHNIQQKTEEWFRWKFERSPYGKTILACAFDGDIVAGCVAMGFGKMTYGNADIKCALSYETFVHPKYQGCHIFTKLTKLAEEECKNQGVKLLYNFPNSKSLPGFIKRGWNKHFISKYKIKFCNLTKCMFYIKDVKKSFIPEQSNLSTIKDINIHDFSALTEEGIFIPQWSKEYLNWRFLSYPVGNYWIYSDKDVFAIARLGHRGRLKQAELLHIQCYKRKLTKQDWSRIYSKLTKDTNIDLIGISASPEHPISKFISHYITVPSRSNFTYKSISDDLEIDTFKMYKCDIDAHTY